MKIEDIFKIELLLNDVTLNIGQLLFTIEASEELVEFNNKMQEIRDIIEKEREFLMPIPEIDKIEPVQK